MDQNLAYEARTFDLGEWLTGPWTQRETSDGSYEVVHQETGKVLAVLPDWAGPIALWMCVARDAVPALLAENDALNKRLLDIRTTEVLSDAARLMEATGRDDDAVNFLDLLASRAERPE